MEYVGWIPNVIYTTIHTPSRNGGHGLGAEYDNHKPIANDYICMQLNGRQIELDGTLMII